MSMRLRDWQSRLQACLAERCARDFEWGRHDCALFASDCVLAVTGVDPAAELRGTYDSAIGALRVIAEQQGLEAIAASKLGPQIHPALAQPGDIGLLEVDGRQSLAVCTGSVWQAAAADGIASRPIEDAARAWRVVREAA